MARMIIKVQTYSGYKADERPVAFTIGDTTISVTEILDRWYGPDHSYFKLHAENRKVYIIRHDTRADEWEIVMMEDPDQPGL